MNTMKKYMALLVLYENNCRVLHWLVCNTDFHTAHERYGSYYEKLGSFMDETAEIMLTCGGENPVNVFQAYDMLKDDDDTHGIICSTDIAYTVPLADRAALDMFEQLYKLAEELADEDDLPVDVCDVFMAHAKWYRIEGMYKLGRALNVPAAGVHDEEHEEDEGEDE